MKKSKLLSIFFLLGSFVILAGCSGDSPPGATAISTGTGSTGGTTSNSEALAALELGNTTWISSCVLVEGGSRGPSGIYNHYFEFQFNDSPSQYLLIERTFDSDNTSCSGSPYAQYETDYEISFGASLVTSEGLTAWTYDGELVDTDDTLNGWAFSRGGHIYRDGDTFYLEQGGDSLNFDYQYTLQ